MSADAPPPDRPGAPLRLRTLSAIFFASGFAGLIYESIWSHYLKLFLGHAAYAQTLVLAIFMGGMAIGAALAARHSHRIANPLRAYAAVEAVIGVCAIGFHTIFVAATDGFYGLAAQAGLGGAGFAALKWGLATLLILPQSILLGATFPLFAAAATRALPAHEGRSIATLYFANSLGGALGVLGSGFALIPQLGLPGTIMLAGGINLAIAAAVLRLAGPQPVPAPPQSGAQAPGPMVALLLAVSFLTGASSFVYEVGWIRMLSLVLGSATHSFELMLSSFILGLALGGLWVRRRIDAAANPGRLLGRVQIAMGLAAVATIPLHNLSFDLVAYAIGHLPRTDRGYDAFNLIRYGIASLIMLPAAFCAGMTLPLVTRLLFSLRGQGERAIGWVYSANTVGAIAGIAFAVHVGLPVLGLDHLVAVGALIDVALGGVLLAVYAGRGWLPRTALAVAACVAAGALGAASFDPRKLASGVFRSGKAVTEGRIVEIAHGKTATISVETNGDTVTIRTNGKPDAAARTLPGAHYEMDEVTMTLTGAVPLMLHDRPARVANIGFGSGMTGATILDDARVERLDSVEIEPAMVRLARHYGAVNRSVYDDPRSAIHIDDAKSFFASGSGGAYDLIVSEPSNPWVSGVAGLFSVEFYRHVRRHLKPDGLFAQWLQIYETDADRVASVMKALQQSFDDYLVFALEYGNILIVARPQGTIALRADAYDRVGSAVQRRLQRLQVDRASDILYRTIGNRRVFEPWLAARAVPANSDYRPYLDNHADRDRFVGSNWNELFSLGQSAYPVAELLGVRPAYPAPACITINGHFGSEPPAAGAGVAADLLSGTHRYASACPARVGTSVAALQSGRKLNDACRAPPWGDHGYGAAGLAIWVLPFLSPEEGQALLDSARELACLDPTPPRPAAWPALLQRIAARDAAGIAAEAEHLLAGGHGGTEARSRYLLAMALLGHLASAQTEQARQAWATYAPRIVGDKAPGLVLELLRDHAQQQPR